MQRLLSSIGFTAALLCPWTAFAQTPPTSCTTTSQNLRVRDQLNTYYYWYQFLTPSVNPASFNSPDAYLDAVRYRPLDVFSYITDKASNDAFYSDSQFIGYGFGQQTSLTDIRVLQVYDDSPASESGLRRGDRIVSVNGQSVSTMAANGTIGNAFGAATIGVVTTIDWETLEGQRRSARMVKRLVTIPTVSLTRVVDVDGRRVGYLFFRNFVSPSTAALSDAFAALKAAGANELVLDLRYNSGGLVDVAEYLASLIGGVRTNGQVMIHWVNNDKIGPVYNKTSRFSNPHQALDLQRLVVIATRGTASASELVINALRPYIPVTIVGNTTYGKPVGQRGREFCDKVLAAVEFSLKNANLEGDFFDGLQVDCPAGDDYLHPLGDTAEASFAEALTFIRTGACSARATAERLRPYSAAQVTFRPTGWAAILNAQ